MKITIGINSLSATSYEAYTNHIQLFYRLGRNFGKDLSVVLVNPARCSIDRMRNLAAKTALETESDYLLFIDDDVLVPVDGLQKLIACDADIAAGNVIIRGYPFKYMFFKGDEKGLEAYQELPPENPLPVGAVGFSFCLIKTSLLSKIPLPYFVTGVTNTEDIYFCLKAKRLCPDTTIVVDTSIKCGHILWPEVISEDNRTAYKKYWEETNPDVLKEPISSDRGDEYLKLVKGALKCSS